MAWDAPSNAKAACGGDPQHLGAVGNIDGEVGVSLALEAEHTRQRRALGYLFTNSALLQHERLLRQHIQKLVAVLKDMADKNQPVDFLSWCKP
jgi:cytochrome P450